jgi:hypothetical protein
MNIATTKMMATDFFSLNLRGSSDRMRVDAFTLVRLGVHLTDGDYPLKGLRRTPGCAMDVALVMQESPWCSQRGPQCHFVVSLHRQSGTLGWTIGSKRAHHRETAGGGGEEEGCSVVLECEGVREEVQDRSVVPDVVGAIGSPLEDVRFDRLEPGVLLSSLLQGDRRDIQHADVRPTIRDQRETDRLRATTHVENRPFA